MFLFFNLCVCVCVCMYNRLCLKKPVVLKQTLHGLLQKSLLTKGHSPEPGSFEGLKQEGREHGRRGPGGLRGSKLSPFVHSFILGWLNYLSWWKYREYTCQPRKQMKEMINKAGIKKLQESRGKWTFLTGTQDISSLPLHHLEGKLRPCIGQPE